MIDQARDLLNGQVTTAPADVVRAAHEAATHARALLRAPVPPFTFTWVDHPRGYFGQAVMYADGPAEIRLRRDLSVHRVRLVVFHELAHLAGHRTEAEANEFELLAAREFDALRKGGSMFCYGSLENEYTTERLETYRRFQEVVARHAGRRASAGAAAPQHLGCRGGGRLLPSPHAPTALRCNFCWTIFPASMFSRN